MTDDPIQILIASDYPVTRAGLRAILGGSEQCAVAGEAPLADLPAEAVSLRPDVVLLDVSSGEQDELEILSRLMSELPAVGVVVLSGDPGDAPAAEALQAGVRGYLLR